MNNVTIIREKQEEKSGVVSLCQKLMDTSGTRRGKASRGVLDTGWRFGDYFMMGLNDVGVFRANLNLLLGAILDTTCR